MNPQSQIAAVFRNYILDIKWKFSIFGAGKSNRFTVSFVLNRALCNPVWCLAMAAAWYSAECSLRSLSSLTVKCLLWLGCQTASEFTLTYSPYWEYSQVAWFIVQISFIDITISWWWYTVCICFHRWWSSNVQVCTSPWTSVQGGFSEMWVSNTAFCSHTDHCSPCSFQNMRQIRCWWGSLSIPLADHKIWF